MRIIEVTTKVVDPTGPNIAVESHTEVLSKGEGESKIIIEANTKATTGNIIPPAAAIIIIIVAIIMVEVAVEETIIDHTVVEEAITEATTTINTINITCMIMDPS